MTPYELRKRLLDDILHDEDPAFSGTPLELPVKYLLPIFDDTTIPSWCNAVGVEYEINTSPDPAFDSPTTIIFSPKPYLRNSPDSSL